MGKGQALRGSHPGGTSWRAWGRGDAGPVPCGACHRLLPLPPASSWTRSEIGSAWPTC